MPPKKRTAKAAPIPAASAHLNRQDWIAAARATLIANGVDGISVNALAAEMAVTRGSFYWHFQSREDLLDALLDDWSQRAIEPFARGIAQDPKRPHRQLLRFVDVWLDAAQFNPALDSAMRDWARTVPKVDALVRSIDDQRVAMLKRIFVAAGYDALEAEIRARILYYHQVGYYSLRIVEPIELRRRLMPIYFRIIAGFPLPGDR